jgi:pimeloyl-ACP methyl ester carboxylesterase
MPVGRSFRAVLIAVLAAGAVAAAPSAASAACPKDVQCARVTVPLDHTGATAGTLSLAYAKVPATGTRTGTLVLLSGGPGQAALDLTEPIAELLKPLRRNYDVVGIDQRGTGDSGAVSCKLTEKDAVEACAAKLGDRRAFFNTPETARDLESLRVALGVEKLTLLGVSYGAKVAAEYARRYPAQTAALVLDSPTPVDGLDGYDQLRTLGAPRVLREVCFPGPCHTTVTDPDEALAAAASRLQDGAIRGPLVSASGRVRQVRVTESDLYSVLAASDLNPGLRQGLPAAIASLAEGDSAPLLHLAALLGSDDDESGGINSARLLATSCIESRLPWAPDSPVASRADALKAFVAAHSDGFAPFSAKTVLASSVTGLCEKWPPTPRPEGVSYLGPDVPVLVLSGRADLRTPLEDARRTAAQYPNAKVLAVPGVGHSVLTSDVTGCAVKGTVAFLSGKTVAQCSKTSVLGRYQNLSAPYTPATIAGLRPQLLSGLPGRTFSAVSVTLSGLGYDLAYKPVFNAVRLPGLRAGYYRTSRSSLELHGVEWIRGVRISGRLGQQGTGTLTVSGPSAAAGTVTFGKNSVSGTLGGKSFSEQEAS